MTHTSNRADAPSKGAPELTPLKRAFLALEEAQARIAKLEQAEREPIAVIGMSCRVPGAEGTTSFWNVLREGVDAIGPVPADRWDVNALYDPDPQVSGRISTRHGGFLRSVDEFDAGLFGIAPREAQGMDPQQRLLLEVSWEALESAGQAPDSLERSPTGVYVGVASADYAYLQLKARDPSLLDAHFTSGIAHSILSGRVSYLLGLQGPSLAIDTACSSSLVAVHLACQALRSGDCRMALAGGVNLILSPDLYIALSRARMLAPDGRCKTFDAAADGFARGEGCGVVVLKRLSDAQADGDTVLAVIRGSALNQDGASSSMTAPNGLAQEAVIRDALERSGVKPSEVGFVEAHGTGTELGDPLEVRALGAVFGADRRAAPLIVGSVKTNIGHLEAAAGVTGLIKVILSLQHRMIPAHLHFSAPSPHIPWTDLPIRVLTTLQAWEPIGGRRIAGISSFGFSGTNAHLVVEEAPPQLSRSASSPVKRSSILALSARSDIALRQLARNYASALIGRADDELPDICHTANVGRAHHEHRATIIASSIADVQRCLQALADGEEMTGLQTAHVARRDPPRVAFVFTGQGAQYAGMARELYDSSPVFREALDRCAAILAPLLDRPLLEVLFPKDGGSTPLDETGYTQPALFAVEYALSELWRSWGVAPTVVMGHSVGEYVAACAAGVLSLEDGLRLIAKRGALMQSLPSGGAMAAIFASEKDVEQALAPYASLVSVAAVNTAGQVVVSGQASDVDRLCQIFSERGVRSQRLTVSHAFHSPLVEPILGLFEAEAQNVQFARPSIRFVSNLTGETADPEEIRRPSYWRRHVREPVRFAEGARTLARLKTELIVEVGPHPTLLSFVAAELGADAVTCVASLRRGRSDWEQMLESLAKVYLAGGSVSWRAVFRDARHRVIQLPSYPFQGERHWFQANAAIAPITIDAAPARFPLLGRRVRSAGAQVIHEAHVAADAPGFVRQHQVLGRVVLPASAYLDMLTVAARRTLGAELVSIEDVVIREAMLLEDDGSPLAVQIVCDAPREGVVTTAISSARADADENATWAAHVSASFRIGTASAASNMALDDLRKECGELLEPSEFYAEFQRRGIEFGEGFRAVRRLWRGDARALGEIELASGLAAEADAYAMHPVLLDACLQVMAAALPAEGRELFLPIGVGRYTLLRKPQSRCWSYVTVHDGAGDTRRADVHVFDADGTVLAAIRDIQLKRTTSDSLARLGERWLDTSLYDIGWEPAPTRAGGADDVPVASLVAVAEPHIERLAESAGIAAYDGFLPRFEALCAGYAMRTMVDLGWSPARGERVVVEELVNKLGIRPRHRQLFERLLSILAEEGLLRRSGRGWEVAQPFDNPRPGQIAQRLLKECPKGAEAELELTASAGAGLARALRGECDPLQLLFPGGSLAVAERLYRDSPTATFFGGLTAEILAAAAAARRLGRPLRILEVGAGTGGTTAHVLPRLAEHEVEYTFTDVGQAFVARAQERFGTHAFMKFETLDLEKDPEAQGFARPYDVVIASNVIHATADLRATLARVRRLLVPGGILAMLEVTAPQRWFDLTVGLTPGWWAFADKDLRPDYAAISREAWIQLLPQCGFESADALPRQGGRQGSLALQSLFLAKAATPAAQAAGDWLIFADRGGVASALARRLQGQGGRCTLIRPGDFASGSSIDPQAVGDYSRLLAELRSEGRHPRGVIHAWSLDTEPDGGASAGDPAGQTLSGVSAMLLARALVGIADVPRLWIVTRGAQQAAAHDASLAPVQALAWGVNKTLTIEHPELRGVAIDLDPAQTTDEIDLLCAELFEPGDETQVAFRDGDRRLARLTRLRRNSDVGPAAWRLLPASPGVIDEFRREPLDRKRPGQGEVEIAVDATGLNFKDVLNVMGLYPGDPGPLGGECAGRVSAIGPGVTNLRIGDEVLAVASGSFASHAIARAELVQPIPPGVSIEEAAAFPIAFLTAEFCLSHLARMRAEDRVLIHAAAGGVGMAAVRLAQRAGAQVFATAGSDWKRDLLRSMGVEHVFDSRNSSFAERILERTSGRGVDIVLNSLSGDMIEASFRAIGRGGRFVEIGKRGIKDAAWVAALDRDLDYHVVDWGVSAAEDPALIGNMLARLVGDLRRGSIEPLPRHTFSIAEAARAFRFMAQARHAGKIVVRHRPLASAPVRREGTYVVTGGLSGLGLAVGRWLAHSGAGRIVLLGRRGVTSELEGELDELRAHCTVVARSVDVTNSAAVADLLGSLRKNGPPIRGIVHSAGVLDDAGLLQQDAERFSRVLAPKLEGALIFDRLTRTDPLDFFVAFSSIAAVLGSAGQANHAAANAFLDVFARERRLRGLPGLSVNWGAWSELGAAVDRGLVERLSARGLGAVTSGQGLHALERLLADGTAQAIVLPADWRQYAETHASGRVPSFLANVVGAVATASASTKSPVKSVGLREQLANVPQSRWRITVAGFIRERALRALGLRPDTELDPQTPLGEMGLDSLLAVELRTTLSLAVGQPLPATLLFDYPTLDALTDFAMSDVLGVTPAAGETETESGPTGTNIVGKIADLSDEEVDRLLAARVGA